VSQNINDLRKTLFETLRGVKDGTVSVEKAKAVSDLSQNIINTAKVEIDYLKAGGKVTSEFIEVSQLKQPDAAGPQPVVTRIHRLGN
jgi:hypothetical protein